MAADHFLGPAIVDKLFGAKRAALKADIHRTLSLAPRQELQEVDRPDSLSRETFFREYLEPGVPVVFEKAAAQWPCVKTWTHEFLEERYGDDYVKITDGTGYVHEKGIEFEHLTFRELIGDIRGEGSRYLTFYPLLAQHPELTEDFDIDWLKSHRGMSTFFSIYQCFLGGKGSRTRMHNSMSSNLFVQVYGKKTWTLYPPAYAPIIDPMCNRSIYRKSTFEPHPDQEGYAPIAAHLQGFTTCLQPGDILFNPPYYWHYVVNESDSIGLGYRWNSYKHALRLSKIMTFLDLFSTNPPMWKMLYYFFKKKV